MARVKDVDKAELLDFSVIEESEGFAPVPVSKYVLRVESADVRVGKESGNPFVNVATVVVEDKDGGQYRGRYIWHAISLVGSTPETTKTVQGMAKKVYRVITGEEFTVKGVTAADAAVAIARDIKGGTFVGRVKISVPNEEEVKNGYTPKNVIVDFAPATEWEKEGKLGW